VNARPILTAALLFATAPALYAGTVLTFQEKVPGSQGEAGTVRQVFLDGPRLRVETITKERGNRLLIYQAGTGTLWVIDPAGRSYTEIHRAEVPFNTEEVKVGAPGAQPPANPSPIQVTPAGIAYKKVDSGFIVNGFRTDKYEGTQNGRKVEEVYVADPKALGMEAADLKTLHVMAETLALQGQGRTHLSFAAEAPGVPVRTVRFEGGKPVLQIDLGGVRKEEIPATAFELPAGFTRQAQGLASP